MVGLNPVNLYPLGDTVISLMGQTFDIKKENVVAQEILFTILPDSWIKMVAMHIRIFLAFLLHKDTITFLCFNFFERQSSGRFVETTECDYWE